MDKSKLIEYLKKPLIGEQKALGLDIGTRHIKLAQIKKTPGGYSLEKYGIIELPPEAIVDREIMDREVLIESLRKIIEDNGVEEKKVSTVISGKNVIIKKLLAKSPKKREEKKVFESLAKENIPFDLKEVVIDFKKLREKDEDIELVLVGAKNEVLYPLIDVLKEASLLPCNIDIPPFILKSAYQKYIPEEGTCLLVNIGFEHVLIMAVRDGNYLFDDEIPMGVRTFIEEIQRICGIGAKEATAVLQGEEVQDVKERDIQRAKNTTIKRLLSRIERLLPEISEWKLIILGGGGAGIPGIQETFAEKFNTSCEIGNPLKEIECGETLPDYPHQLDIAIGLAISKLENTGVNLLPLEERLEEKNKILQALDQGLPSYSFIGSVLILSLIVLGITKKQRRIEREIEDMKTQQEALIPKVQEARELMRKEKEVRTKVKVIQDLSMYKYARVKLLDEINRLIPEYTWLVTLNEELADSIGGIGILLRGITTSNFAVSEFMHRLEDSNCFTEVELSYTKRGEISGTETTEFEIKSRFKEFKK
ncbi:type IV pilus assembly protein PilM [candidate division WOR-3 bacterium]|nr:type IV pilus assembly protein PilM [candidate division WOR-3 bacterium]